MNLCVEGEFTRGSTVRAGLPIAIVLPLVVYYFIFTCFRIVFDRRIHEVRRIWTENDDRLELRELSVSFFDDGWNGVDRRIEKYE